MANASRKGIPSESITFCALTALTIQTVVLANWGTHYYLLRQSTGPLLGWDFVVFWSAARVTLEHGAAMVFSPTVLHEMEAAVGHFREIGPWAYPPTFLLALIPFGLFSFATAFGLFSAAGLAVYAVALRRAVRGLDPPYMLFAAGFSGVGVALAAGQNSLLTTAAAAGATLLLDSNPILAGTCVAALAIKPQLAVLFPLALACGRKWKALAASAAWALAFATVATAILGADAWTVFAAHLPSFNQRFVEHGSTHWAAMPTVFAAARLAGASVPAAYVAQALIGVPAAAAVAYLWLCDARFELRVSALALGTLLVQPYLMYYDLAWLSLPIVMLLHDAKTVELSRIEWILVGATWLVPAQAFIAVGFDFPCHIATVVMIALLVAVVRRHLAVRRRCG
ncbi:uncharacterized protein DUF2029 [Trinickia symbiotica]|uniref:DUF2029 domain-containing protein n=1 Tax=Trinickia symbiotica TaxID=863227 RepID=A0A2N7XA67_9BURK|nr:glycosyltransferase family 87 protein [Trinickia symbiotica]PMS38656.1 hypothetical protein C0Z20_02000 [Trinickia symbiotica]PPK46670.1 uncharacterized protein DUF2029 [Trinickia symbiotica]